MSKVLTFSQVYPKKHPKAGLPTMFVEKIYKCLFLMKVVPPELVGNYNFEIMNDDINGPKRHSIRAGRRWKSGDKCSMRVWSGKPYQSKQIVIADEIELPIVLDIEITVIIYLTHHVLKTNAFCCFRAIRHAQPKQTLYAFSFLPVFLWGFVF